jgi:hypothetical protein
MRYVGFVLFGFCLLLVNVDALNSQEQRCPLLRPAQKQPDKKGKADDTQQKEKAFLKEVEARAKKEGHYAKVEAKGVLSYKQRTTWPAPQPPFQPPFRPFVPEWFLHIGGAHRTTFGLSLPEESDLEKLAKQLDGKTVVVSGPVGVYPYGPYHGAYAALEVETLKEAR